MKRSEAKHTCDSPLPQRESLPRLVNRVPLLPRPHFPGWTRHPVPVARGEVCKLCRIEQGEAVGYTEVVPVPRPWPVTITPSPDHHSLPANTRVETLLAELNPASRRVLGLVADFVLELLAPAHEINGGFHGSNPRKLPVWLSSDDQADVFVLLRDISRHR